MWRSPSKLRRNGINWLNQRWLIFLKFSLGCHLWFNQFIPLLFSFDGDRHIRVFSFSSHHPSANLPNSSKFQVCASNIFLENWQFLDNWQNDYASHGCKYWQMLGSFFKLWTLQFKECHLQSTENYWRASLIMMQGLDSFVATVIHETANLLTVNYANAW